jgi:hypothetical protein
MPVVSSTKPVECIVYNARGVVLCVGASSTVQLLPAPTRLIMASAIRGSFVVDGTTNDR